MTLAAETELKTATLDVKGMKCAGCVSAVERQLSQNEGVRSAQVNLITEIAVIEYQPDAIAPEKLAAKLTAIGFPTQPRTASSPLFQQNQRQENQQKEQQQQLYRLAIASCLLVFSLIGHLHHIGGPEIPIFQSIAFHWTLATLAILFPGRDIFVDGWRGLRHGMPNMNSLVSLGTGSAYIASCLALIFPNLGLECFFDEPVMLLGFILLGRTLEARSRHRAASDLEALTSLQPAVAHVIGSTDDRVGIAIPVEQVRVGEWVRVLPGEKIPVDGEIIHGRTTVDEALLTGESLPVVKEVEDAVIAGSFNLSGAIAVQTRQVGTDTTLAKIIAAVESAQTRKAPVQKLADTVAGYFAYGVMTIAFTILLFWYFWGTRLFPEVLGVATGHHEMMQPTSPLLLSLKLAISVLVVACPCALGLATPTALLVGTSLAAERGILIKGGDVLETVSRLQTVVFDKTGTLTQGYPEITDYLSFSALNPQEILQLAAVVESGTNHPLARAILDAVTPSEMTGEDFQTVAGLGVSARVQGSKIVLGNGQWLAQNGIKIDETTPSIQELLQAGKTVIYLGKEEQLLGAIAFQDQLRPDAESTVNQLKNLGLEVILLSGDRPEVVTAIANNLGISQFYAQVAPAAKSALIADLQTKESKIVAMVGDGINDAPALAQANIGIALAGGTEVAIETAGIVLISDRLEDVVQSLHLSLATWRKIQQNLFWALGYNTFAIPIAGGLLLPRWGIAFSPALAGALMAFSSVMVVSNSLLLRRQFPKTKTTRKDKN
jgi:Cu2+-exporting ATPase